MLGVFFLTSDILAQTPTAPEQAPSFGEQFMAMLPMLLVVFMIFHFMVLRPQQKKIKEQEDLLRSLKKGDEVVTTSGIIGKIAVVESDNVQLEIANNVRIKMELSSITKRKERKEKQEKIANG